jgi:hypothetical protein
MSRSPMEGLNCDNRAAQPMHALHKIIHPAKRHLNRGGTAAANGMAIVEFVN